MVYVPANEFAPMEVFLICTSAVAIAEIGDRTQLLALLLATRFKRPWPVIAGIFVATIINHGLASWLGIEISGWLTPKTLSWLLGISFIATGLWMLIPDKASDESAQKFSRFGPFLTTAFAFFIVEIGDKTQIATMALAARFNDLALVATATTFGMMLANVPVVFLGNAAAERLPLQYVRTTAAAIFFALGVLAILEALNISIPGF